MLNFLFIPSPQLLKAKKLRFQSFENHSCDCFDIPKKAYHSHTKAYQESIVWEQPRAVSGMCPHGSLSVLKHCWFIGLILLDTKYTDSFFEA